jgi:hypothetical protein
MPNPGPTIAGANLDDHRAGSERVAVHRSAGPYPSGLSRGLSHLLRPRIETVVALMADASVRLRSEPDGWVNLDRATKTSNVNLPNRPRPTEIVHPFIDLVAGQRQRFGYARAPGSVAHF